MADAVQVVTHTSYGSRLKKSCCTLLLAPFLILGSIGLLVWNELNSVNMHRALQEGMDAVTELKDQIQQKVTENNGQLIHFSGTVTTNSQVYDNTFGVGSTGDFLKLRRNAEMYQWVESSKSETEKNTGGSTTTTTTYSYSKKWRSNLINSATFEDPTGHQNPTSFLYQDELFVADNIVVGAFTLSDQIVSKINWWESYPNTLSVNQIVDTTAKSSATVSGNMFYIGKGTSTSPQVGDIRVDFDVVKTQTVSIIALQTSTGLTDYTGKSGASFLLVERGQVNAATMFENAVQNQKFKAWMIRLAGWVIMFIAFILLLQPLAVAADVIPMCGNMIERFNLVIAFIFATLISGIVIALSWIAVRPVLAACIFVPFAVILGLLIWQIKKKKQQKGRDLDEDKVPEAEIVEDSDDEDANDPEAQKDE